MKSTLDYKQSNIDLGAGRRRTIIKKRKNQNTYRFLVGRRGDISYRRKFFPL
jgi:hypothetical protein